MKHIILAAAILALGACGGGSSDAGAPANSGAPEIVAVPVENGSTLAVDNGSDAKTDRAGAVQVGNGHADTAAAPAADVKHPDAVQAPAAKAQDAKAKHADVENKGDDHGPKQKQ